MNTPARVEKRKLILDISDESNVYKIPYVEIDFIIPAIYDDMENVDNIKIGERFPKFGFGDLLDEILDDFGGVLDIFTCEWDEAKMEGEVVCLMKNWRVFRYFLKQNELSILDRVSRIKLINKDCLVFEDIDEWSSWKELEGDRAEKSKKEIEEKKELEKQKQSAQDYVSDLQDFFNGDIDKIQKLMQKNKGV